MKDEQRGGGGGGGDDGMVAGDLVCLGLCLWLLFLAGFEYIVAGDLIIPSIPPARPPDSAHAPRDLVYECLVRYTPFYAEDPVMTCRKILRWQQVRMGGVRSRSCTNYNRVSRNFSDIYACVCQGDVCGDVMLGGRGVCMCSRE